MSTRVAVNTFTHSVTHVTGEMIRSLKDIIRWSGLSTQNIIDDWDKVETAIYTLLSSRHLKKMTLEVFTPYTSVLVGRWDFEIEYSYSSGDDGSLWADGDAIRYAIAKCGAVAANCKYEFVILTKPDAPSVPGWGPGGYRSTAGFVQHSIGNTIGAHGMASNTTYWKKAS
jgi:hypothetical protein